MHKMFRGCHQCARRSQNAVLSFRESATSVVSNSARVGRSCSSAETHTSPGAADKEFRCRSRRISSDPDGDSVHLAHYLRTPRRLAASPTLPLEAVALSQEIQNTVLAVAKDKNMTLRDIQLATFAQDGKQTPELCIKPSKRDSSRRSGQPSIYSKEKIALAKAVVALPMSLASNTYVMAEVRRILPQFRPKSMLDFGSGVSPSVTAAARVFRDKIPIHRFSLSEDDVTARSVDCCLNVSSTARPDSANVNGKDDHFGPNSKGEISNSTRDGESRGRSKQDWAASGVAHMSKACLVDHTPIMLGLGLKFLRSDPQVTKSQENISATRSIVLKGCSSLSDCSSPPGEEPQFSLVTASYALSEIVRETKDPREGAVDSEVTLDNSRIAKRRLRKAVRQLWRRVEEGGIFIIIENGTKAGFETVLFARDVILREGDTSKSACAVHAADDETAEFSKYAISSASVDEDEAEDEDEDVEGDERKAYTEQLSHGTSSLIAKVIAPCLHSRSCPLQGNVSSSRICRFVQRFNRPHYLRVVKPSTEGFEDEYFSYIVLQKHAKHSSEMRPESTAELNSGLAELSSEEYEDNNAQDGRYWARLIRKPQMRHKHVVLDGCTAEGVLERRVISKGNSHFRRYQLARRLQWGDVWPSPEPPTTPQEVQF